MKVLFWDIETLPMIKRAWSLWQRFGTPQEVIQDWSIICICYKWLGEKKVHTISVRDGLLKSDINAETVRDDGGVVERFAEVLNSADVVVAHNGIAFDMKKFRARLIKHDGKPLAPVKEYDTLRVAKSLFAFTSNRLDALGEYFGVGRKIKTDYDLWIRCEQGEMKALKEMEKYCRGDILVLEKVYNKLAPHDRLHPNHNVYNKTEDACPTCNSFNVQRRGSRMTRVSEFWRYQCLSCGCWSSRPKSGKGVLR